MHLVSRLVLTYFEMTSALNIIIFIDILFVFRIGHFTYNTINNNERKTIRDIQLIYGFSILGKLNFIRKS